MVTLSLQLPQSALKFKPGITVLKSGAAFTNSFSIIFSISVNVK